MSSGVLARVTDAVARARPALLVASFVLLLLVGLTRPNAAAPDLAPRGWAPGPLIPITLGPAQVTTALWAAYVIGALCVACGLLTRITRELPTWLPPLLAVGAALATPFGSADHVNYAAYGRILALGGNPWTARPDRWPTGDPGSDPVVSRLEAPWTEEPSVYGPFATALHALTSLGGGDNLRQTVWLWQLVIIVSWLAVRWLLRRTLPAHRARIDVVWTANPIVFGVGVLGAHVDLLAVALVVAAVWAVHRYAGWPGFVVAGGFSAFAFSTKFTYAVVIVALIAAVWSVGGGGDGSVGATQGRLRVDRQVRRLVGRCVALLLSSAVVGGAMQWWAGPHVYDQVERSSRAVALASPWRTMLEVFAPMTNGMHPQSGLRQVISVLAAVLAIGLAVCLMRLVRPIDLTVSSAALMWLFVLTSAYCLAAAYTLPWYDLTVWASAAAVVGVGGTVTAPAIMLTRLLVITLAYLPGRVLGMTSAVEGFTMWVRSAAAPIVMVALWVWLVSSAVRVGSWPWPARHRGDNPPPR